jgi:hypothetical protein
MGKEGRVAALNGNPQALDHIAKYKMKNKNKKQEQKQDEPK